MTEKGYYNEITNTAAGIPTPPENQDIGPADSLNEFVKAMMDKIEHDVTGDDEKIDLEQ